MFYCKNMFSSRDLDSCLIPLVLREVVLVAATPPGVGAGAQRGPPARLWKPEDKAAWAPQEEVHPVEATATQVLPGEAITQSAHTGVHSPSISVLILPSM